MDDLISRQAAIKALWLALYEYEDKCKKQFLESKELDVAEWFQHRIFVQNMSDIDRKTIFDLPTIYAVPVVRCRECRWRTDLEHTAWRPCDAMAVNDNWYCAYGERKDDERTDESHG